MSKLSINVGQILKGRHGLYEVIEPLKSNSVFKATILPHSSTSTPFFAVIKTEPNDSLKFIYERERKNYALPDIASCSQIRALKDVIGYDTESRALVQPQCMVFEWMDHDLRLVPFEKFRDDAGLPRVIARAVLEALAVLKEKHNAIHTDINPNNIFLSDIDSSRPIVKVGDLGNMLVEGYNDMRLQSLPTRAPEVWRGLGCWHTSDVWSLGVTLTYWLAQRFVFGATDKIVEDNTEAWCIAKIIRLVGPIEGPVIGDFKSEFALAKALEVGSFVAADGVQKRYITVGTVQQQLEGIQGVSQELIEFILHLLVIDHTKRPTAREALDHPYLASFSA